jgi:hypothetical protein
LKEITPRNLGGIKIMKNKKIFTGVTIFAVGLVITLLVTFSPDEQTLPVSDDVQIPESVKLEMPATIEAEEIENVDETAPAERIRQNPTRPETSTKTAADTVNQAPEVIEIILAPTEAFGEEVMTIIEEYEIEYIESPQIEQTAPPSLSGTPEDAQGTDSDGYFFKVEDGQRYIWNTVVGWCRDDGPGEVTYMDVRSDGYRFYREPDGTVNLDKIITPDGSVISFDEYRKIRAAR